MHTINYQNTLILVATDCAATHGTAPTKPGTVAALQYEMLRDAPYALTSDDLLVAVEAVRRGIGTDEHEALRAEIFAKPQACLRASPLVKTYGWGLHHDDLGRVALVGCDTSDYARMAADPALAKAPGMRSRRG